MKNKDNLIGKIFKLFNKCRFLFLQNLRSGAYLDNMPSTEIQLAVEIRINISIKQTNKQTKTNNNKKPNTKLPN